MAVAVAAAAETEVVAERSDLVESCSSFSKMVRLKSVGWPGEEHKYITLHNTPSAV